MIIREIIWLADVEEKIFRKHHVRAIEVEQVVETFPHIRFMEKGLRPDEDLYAAFGQTAGGRYLAIYFIRKTSAAALIVTARDMTSKEKQTYGRKK